MIEEDIPSDTIFYPYAKLWGVDGEKVEIINCIE